MKTNIVRRCAAFLLLLLGGSSLAVAAPELKIGALDSKYSGGTVPITMVSDSTVVGLEFVVEYVPSEVTVGQITVGVGLGVHKLTSRIIAPGKLKVVVYPPVNNPTMPGGEIARLQISKTAGALAGSDRLKITNVVMTKKTATLVLASALIDGLFLDASSTTKDSDGDGIPDVKEVFEDLHPLDGRDAYQDADGDGLTNLTEYQLGTGLHVTDTDNDTITDGVEVAAGLNPLDSTDAADDPDGDGISSLAEIAAGTNPMINEGAIILLLHKMLDD